MDLENSIKGIDANNGVNFILSRYGGDYDILGVVTYILPESDAADKDIQRGDVFIGVNGQSLNMSNYRALLYGDNLDYTLNMADINNNVISSNGKNIPLTLDLNVKFLQSCKPNILTIAESKIIREGNSIIFTTCELVQDNVLIAHASATNKVLKL